MACTAMALTGADVPVITVKPIGKIYFGVISNGFIYRLSFQVQNNLLTPIMIRVNMHPVDQDEQNLLRILEMPSKIAPGMILNLQLELTADHVATSYFQLDITQDQNDAVVSRTVEANVVSIDTFKHVKKSLQLQKRPVYRSNVEAVGNTPEFEDKMTASVIASMTSNTSLVMMDDDEIEDMMDFPIAPNVYWDPFEKCLRIDPELGKAYADGGMKMKKAMKKTNARRDRRLRDLEEQGFFTYKTLSAMRAERTNFGSSMWGSQSVPEEHFDDPANDNDPDMESMAFSQTTKESSTLLGDGEDDDGQDGQKVLQSDSESDGEGDLLSELIKTGDKEVMHQRRTSGGSLGISGVNTMLDLGRRCGETSQPLTGRTGDGSETSRMSLTGILAMRRAIRERVEKQRRSSVVASMQFAETSASASAIDSERTLKMINSRVAGVKALAQDKLIK